MTTRNVAKRLAMPPVASFVGGRNGTWKVEGMKTIRGPSLEEVQRLEIVEELVQELPSGSKWLLRGVTSNERYTTRLEH